MARRWAAGGGGADETADDLDTFGAPPEIRDRCDPSETPIETIGVLPEGMDAARLFMALSTQWRFAGMDGQPTGLVYGSIESTARLSDISLAPRTFDLLKTMEAEALRVWRERRAER